MGVSVGQLLRQAALRAPDNVGLIDVGANAAARREHSYAALDTDARRVAAQLIASGIEPGARVALLGENSAAFVAAWFGIVYSAAAVVPLGVLSAAPEIAYRLQHAGCDVLICDAARSSLAQDSVRLTSRAVRVVSLQALVNASVEPLPRPLDCEPQATAMVLYTSGTTGKAKGAAISHASLLLHTSGLVHHGLALSPRDVVMCTLPLTHSYGCRITLLAPLYAQAPIVLVPRFEAARTLQLMHDERVSFVAVVPTMLAAWSQLPADVTPSVPSALKWVLSAGAPLPDELARRTEARLGVEVRQGYGMTEATFSAINAPGDQRVIGSVGKPSWGVELRIVDEAGHDVAVGERGEVLARGHNMMTHYLFDPEASYEAARDGFMHSGDIGQLDAEGRLYVVDRKKELIIRGGYNVYPSEVEAVLAEHPDVAEVAVIGRPDAFYGEEVLAVIVPRHAANGCDVAALVSFCSSRLSRTKQPREYALVDALPLGSSGKVQKRELVAWWQAGKLQLCDSEGRAVPKATPSE